MSAVARQRIRIPGHAGRASEAGMPQYGASADQLARIRAEYTEMPGLSLTFAQACRFWQMDARVAAALLDALVAEGFLRCTAEGAFKVADDESR